MRASVKFSSILRLAAVGLAVLPLMVGGATAATLRVAGSGGFLEAINQIAAPFAAATGNKLEVIGGLGTAGAMRALGDGVIDAVFAAREPKEGEAKAKLVAPVFTRTPMVFVTSQAKPNGLRSSDLADVFAAQNPKWDDGTPLRIILRTRVDADTVLVGWAVPGLVAAIERARLRTDIPVAATDQDNVNIAQRLPGSLTIAGYGQIVAEKCDLRFVPIDGVNPSLETLADGSYRLQKPFYLVYAAERSAGAEQLLQFLRSAEAQKILLKLGYLPPAE